MIGLGKLETSKKKGPVLLNCVNSKKKDNLEKGSGPAKRKPLKKTEKKEGCDPSHIFNKKIGEKKKKVGFKCKNKKGRV